MTSPHGNGQFLGTRTSGSPTVKILQLLAVPPWFIRPQTMQYCREDQYPEYKTWEFQLYMFSIASILLYSILPLKYWSHYCQLIHGFQIVCQYSLIHEQLKDAHALLCVWNATLNSFITSFVTTASTLFVLLCTKSFILFQRLFKKGLRSAMHSGPWNELLVTWVNRFTNPPNHMQTSLKRASAAPKSIRWFLSCQSSTLLPKDLPVVLLASATAMYMLLCKQSKYLSLWTTLSLKFYATIYLWIKRFIVLINGQGYSFRTGKLLALPGGRRSSHRRTYESPGTLRYVSC